MQNFISGPWSVSAALQTPNQEASNVYWVWGCLKLNAVVRGRAQ
jgi:hypothetical protein